MKKSREGLRFGGGLHRDKHRQRGEETERQQKDRETENTYLSGTVALYRVTSPLRKRTPPGPYRRPMPRVLKGSWGGGRFLMGEVPLYRPPASVQGGNTLNRVKDFFNRRPWPESGRDCLAIFARQRRGATHLWQRWPLKRKKGVGIWALMAHT